MRPTRRWFAAAVCGALLSSLFAAAAVAKPPSVTKIRFKLDAHHVTEGANVTSTIHVWTRSDHAWAPLMGAVLELKVDGSQVGMLTTDADGIASVLYTANDVGGHVMKVFYAGDDLHRRARRAQGFEVEPAPAPDPSPTGASPDAPVLAASNGPGMVSLSWSIPAEGGFPITGYNVYRGELSGTETLLVSGVTGVWYDDLSGTVGTTYYYVVTAVNAAGESPWSNEVAGTPAA